MIDGVVFLYLFQYYHNAVRAAVYTRRHAASLHFLNAAGGNISDSVL